MFKVKLSFKFYSLSLLQVRVQSSSIFPFFLSIFNPLLLFYPIPNRLDNLQPSHTFKSILQFDFQSMLDHPSEH
ncbi:hypothetical protein DFH28DRAFT_965460, partial [Melampsora americana]